MARITEQEVASGEANIARYMEQQSQSSIGGPVSARSRAAPAASLPKAVESTATITNRSNAGVRVGGTPYGPATSAVSNIVDVNQDKWKGIM